jgi:hypothetical protein
MGVEHGFCSGLGDNACVTYHFKGRLSKVLERGWTTPCGSSHRLQGWVEGWHAVKRDLFCFSWCYISPHPSAGEGVGAWGPGAGL